MGATCSRIKPPVECGVDRAMQADTYRRMAKLTGGDWAAQTPATNAAWLVSSASPQGMADSERQ